jgi:hypothetical protein
VVLAKAVGTANNVSTTIHMSLIMDFTVASLFRCADN